MPTGYANRMNTDQSTNDSLIASLDLSDSTSIDIGAAADDLVKATADCGFLYVNLGNRNAITIENVRRAQRAFFALPVLSLIHI